MKRCKNAQKNCKIGIKNNKKQFQIVVHPVTILFAIASIFVGMFWLFFAYFFSLFFHEFMHYLVAKRLGYFCKKITLYPTGAILYGRFDEFTFFDEILISLAGPISNFFLCVLIVFLWWIFPEIYNFTTDFVVANLSLAVFNLLPIYPLDGGRVLLAILSLKTKRDTACNITKNITITFSLLLFFVFVASLFFSPNFQIGIMSVLIFISAISEDKNAVYKRIVKSDIKRRKLLHGLKRQSLMFSVDVKLSKILSKIDNFAFYSVEIVDDNFCVIARFSEVQLQEWSLTEFLQKPIGELIKQIKGSC